jgi:hypothetical protein
LLLVSGLPCNRKEQRVRIHILGINHQVQPADIRSWGSNGEPQRFEQDQKERYAALVEQVVRENNVEIVAEETQHGLDTVTRRACERANCRCANIEMPPDVRTARGIPPGYNENENTAPADCVRWNRDREDYMATQAITEAGDAQSAMVICGRMHVRPLAERFSEAGHTVETSDLQDHSWYVEDWMTHMMRL